MESLEKQAGVSLCLKWGVESSYREPLFLRGHENSREEGTKEEVEMDASQQELSPGDAWQGLTDSIFC